MEKKLAVPTHISLAQAAVALTLGLITLCSTAWGGAKLAVSTISDQRTAVMAEKLRSETSKQISELETEMRERDAQLAPLSEIAARREALENMSARIAEIKQDTAEVRRLQLEEARAASRPWYRR
jgi:hypothetical protein